MHDERDAEGESIILRVTLPVAPRALYDAWLDPEQHGAFTGGAASCEAKVGGRFTAWDGYIEGQNLELVPAVRIVQAWRTADFDDDAPDSRLEVRFASAPRAGTELTLVHTALPEGGAQKYGEGWEEHYLAPMRAYFGARG
jgi:uncharacterized protein YndB with AHSA1/START domain